MGQKQDWNEVEKLDPEGYAEINEGMACLHGPVESVHVDETDTVVIRLKWTAKVELDDSGIPKGDWVAAANRPIKFPNFMVPYVIEDTPEKGSRIRFGSSIIYIGPVKGVDPKKVRGLAI